MPYKSKKQAAYIHMMAAKGVPWAVKFVKDAHGSHVQEKEKVERSKKLKKVAHRKRRKISAKP